MILWADAVNGSFELIGGMVQILNIKALLRDKKVSGISWLSTFYFTGWGIWNCVYYPILHQWISFAGGVLIIGCNITWLILLFHYSRKHKKNTFVNFFQSIKFGH